MWLASGGRSKCFPWTSDLPCCSWEPEEPSVDALFCSCESHAIQSAYARTRGVGLNLRMVCFDSGTGRAGPRWKRITGNPWNSPKCSANWDPCVKCALRWGAYLASLPRTNWEQSSRKGCKHGCTTRTIRSLLHSPHYSVCSQQTTQHKQCILAKCREYTIEQCRSLCYRTVRIPALQRAKSHNGLGAAACMRRAGCLPSSVRCGLQ